jgi:hypothetical protein
MNKKNVVSEPDFLAAVEHAKLIAVSIGKKELNPALLRAGFLALVSSDRPLEEIALSDLKDLLLASCVRLSFPADIPQSISDSIKLPVSNRLRQLLECHYESVAEFVSILVEDGSPLNETDEEIFEKVLLRAGGWLSRQKGAAKLSREVIGAAAYYCYIAGDCVSYPGISVHASLCSQNIEALIKHKKWSENLFAPETRVTVKLDDDLKNELAIAKSGPVIASLDWAAISGLRFISEYSTAIHEAGHTVASFILRPQVPIAQVSIVGLSDSVGRTTIDTNSAYISLTSSRKFFREEIRILLAGGIAEQIAFGDDFIDAGARSDIERATRSTWEWVAQLGLDDSFGPISLPALTDAPGYAASHLQFEAQRTVQCLLKEAYEETKELLKKNWHYVEMLSKKLIENKILGLDDVVKVFLDRGIADWPGTCKVRSLPIRRQVKFAFKEGVCATIEGPVRYQKGDALVTGENQESWPISFDRFSKTYKPIGLHAMGQDGEYCKIPKQAIALRLSTSRTIALSEGRGALTGKAGDWLVDYGDGDLSIVAADLFSNYYETIK